MKKNYKQSGNLYITNVIYYIHYITYYTFYMWPLEKEEGNVREFISPIFICNRSSAPPSGGRLARVKRAAAAAA